MHSIVRQGFKGTISKQCKRKISTTLPVLAKEPPNNLETFNLISKAQIQHNSGKDTALNAFTYFSKLREVKSPLLSETYTQLPDDTQFITKYYDRLIRYRDLICGTGGKFDNLENVEELFLKLSDISPINKNNSKGISELIEKEIKSFDSFIEELVTLFKRNGGHLFILDLGIYNVQVFEHFEKVGHHV